MEQKEVSIIGLSIKQDFGYLKATELHFNPDNALTFIMGEVGAGKSTLNKAMRLTTLGSNTLVDKSLLGDDVHLETQLLDGELDVFVSCKSAKDGSLVYSLYAKDKDGNKVKEPVIDGVKATPAKYLETLQTQLTWRLDELTNENPTVQRKILLEMYADKLAEVGVIFEKSHPKYNDGIIAQIEKAKHERSLFDMKRKEVGGIAEDLNAKGISTEERRLIKPVTEIETEISNKEKDLHLKKNTPETTKREKLAELKNEGVEVSSKLKDENRKIQKENEAIDSKKKNQDEKVSEIEKTLSSLIPNAFAVKNIIAEIKKNLEEISDKSIEISFNEKGNCISKPEEFEKNEVVKTLIEQYLKIGQDYVTTNNQEPQKVDCKKEESAIEKLKTDLEKLKQKNQDAIAVNAFHDWKDANIKVNDLSNDYFMKLTEIETGVEGLKICPEYTTDENGKHIAKGNDIFLMYNGAYDVKYFNNPKKELRKLSSYSETQKPVICLLIQNYLLSKKSKKLPYLWIDNVPIDNKTKELLNKMAIELDLKLFVNWTGDFNRDSLQDGDILIENGEIFFKEN